MGICLGKYVWRILGVHFAKLLAKYTGQQGHDAGEVGALGPCEGRGAVATLCTSS